MRKFSTEPSVVSTCTVGVLDYALYRDRLLALVENRGRVKNAETIAALNQLIGTIKQTGRREEASQQLERVEASLSSGRWHSGAAGHVLDLSCTEETTSFADMIPVFQTIVDFLYSWDEAHAEEIARFFAEVSDFTVPWASPSDIWRAVVPPERIGPLAEAVGALTPRTLRKVLEEIDDGLAFSGDEAEELAEWWGSLRKQVRLAGRREQGLLLAVRTRS